MNGSLIDFAETISKLPPEHKGKLQTTLKNRLMALPSEKRNEALYRISLRTSPEFANELSIPPIVEQAYEQAQPQPQVAPTPTWGGVHQLAAPHPAASPAQPAGWQKAFTWVQQKAIKPFQGALELGMTKLLPGKQWAEARWEEFETPLGAEKLKRLVGDTGTWAKLAALKEVERETFPGERAIENIFIDPLLFVGAGAATAARKAALKAGIIWGAKALKPIEAADIALAKLMALPITLPLKGAGIVARKGMAAFLPKGRLILIPPTEELIYDLIKATPPWRQKPVIRQILGAISPRLVADNPVAVAKILEGRMRKLANDSIGIAIRRLAVLKMPKTVAGIVTDPLVKQIRNLPNDKLSMARHEIIEYSERFDMPLKYRQFVDEVRAISKELSDMLTQEKVKFHKLQGEPDWVYLHRVVVSVKEDFAHTLANEIQQAVGAALPRQADEGAWNYLIRVMEAVKAGTIVPDAALDRLIVQIADVADIGKIRQRLDRPRFYELVAEGLAKGVKYADSPIDELVAQARASYDLVIKKRVEEVLEGLTVAKEELIGMELAEAPRIWRQTVREAERAVAATNRAMRGEAVPAATIRAIEEEFPEIGQRLTQALSMEIPEVERVIDNLAREFGVTTKLSLAKFREALSAFRITQRGFAPLYQATEVVAKFKPQRVTKQEISDALVSIAETPTPAPAKVAPTPRVEPVVPGVAKEPWQMTNNEYWDSYREKYISKYGEEPVSSAKLSLGTKHQQSVQQAYSEGKPVPPEVLKDYPDLVAKAKPATPAEAIKPLPVAEAAAGGASAIKWALKWRKNVPLSANAIRQKIATFTQDELRDLYEKLWGTGKGSLAYEVSVTGRVTPEFSQKFVTLPEIQQALSSLNITARTTNIMLRRIYRSASQFAKAEKQTALKAIREDAKDQLTLARRSAGAAERAKTRAMEGAITPEMGQVIGFPGLSGRVFITHQFGGQRHLGRDIARMVDDQFGFKRPTIAGKTLEALGQTAGVLRALKASLDLSMQGILTLPTLGLDVRNWLRLKPSAMWARGAGRGAIAGLQAGFNPDALKKYLANPEIMAINQERAMHNAIVTEAAEFAEAMPLLQKLIKKIPIAGKVIAIPYNMAEAAFTVGRDATSRYLWVAEKAKIVKEIADPVLQSQRLDELGKWTNLATGATSTLAAGIPAINRALEQVLAFAPRYTRSVAETVTLVVKGGWTAGEARKALSGLFIAGITFPTFISIALGQKPRLNPLPESMGGDGAKFASVRIGDSYVSWAGTLMGLARLLPTIAVQAVQDPTKLIELSMDNPTVRFLRGKASPVVSLGLDYVTGRGFLGEVTRDNFGQVFGTLADWGLPIWAEALKEREGIEGIPFEFFGGRSFPVSLGQKRNELRDTYAAQLPNSPTWQDLTPDEKHSVESQHPDLVEITRQAEEKAKARATGVFQLTNEYLDRMETAKQTYAEDLWKLQRAYDKGVLKTPREFREATKVAGIELGTTYELLANEPRYADARKQLNEWQATGEETTRPKKAAYNEYVTLFYSGDLEDEFGLYDYRERARRVAQFIARWGQPLYDEIVREHRQSKNYPPMMRALWQSQDALKPYWELEARILALFPPGTTEIYNKVTQLQQTSPGEARALLAQNPQVALAKRMIRQAKEKWRAEHPQEDWLLQFWY